MLVKYLPIIVTLLGVGIVAKPVLAPIKTDVRIQNSPSPALSALDPTRQGWRNADGTRRSPGSASPLRIQGNVGPSENQRSNNPGGMNPPNNTPTGARKRDVIDQLAKRAAFDAYDEIVARFAEPEPEPVAEAWEFDFEQGGFVARDIETDDSLDWY